MMNPIEVWYAIPSANAANCAEVLPSWRERGYKIAVLQDKDKRFDVAADIVAAPFDRYPGYGKAINHLIRNVVPRTAPIIVTGGDDMFPDLVFTAQEIAAQFMQRFPDTFGVMQPMGDKYGNTVNICGSPWIGREFARRAYLGRGPYCREYFQLYEDQELHDVAERLGVLWKRPDLSHYHKHWQRGDQNAEAPVYLRASLAREAESKALFEAREKAEFPGHTPLRRTAGAPVVIQRRNPIKLSILVPSIPSRIKGHLLPLLDKLRDQTEGRSDVEVLTFCDNKKRSVGLKRDGLVKLARGAFCAFVDDDDDISPDYVSELCEAIARNPDADVITFKQVSRINDDNPYIVDFSLAHENEPARRDASGCWVDIKRRPYHICAWRTELARHYDFPDASYGEDWHWAKRVALDCLREVKIDRVLHYYFYRDDTTEAALVFPTATAAA